MSFFESSFLWFEAVVASMAIASVCAVVGVYTILRRVVFLPAALSQISGLGVVFAFMLVIWIPGIGDTWMGRPDFVTTVITLGAALLLGWLPEPRHLSRESIIGVAYIAASAFVIMVGDRIPQEAHDIKDILFGNAVVVAPEQMYGALVVAAVVLLVHAVMFRPFLLASFDSDTAMAHGVPVRFVDGILFLTMGLTISVGTKTIGAMPVFAFSVIPAAAALKMFQNTHRIFFGAGLIGAGSAFLGYFLSFVWSFPTGACMVAVSSLFFVLAVIMEYRPRRKKGKQYQRIAG